MINLKITNQEEITQYRSKKREDKKTVGGVTFSSGTHKEDFTGGPWSKIHIIDGTPVNATIAAEHRYGPITFKIHGPAPKDLIVNISENFRAVSKENATWTF